MRSSLAPGASPTNIRSASALPAAEDDLVARRRQLRASHAAARLLEDELELLASGGGRGHRAERNGGSSWVSCDTKAVTFGDGPSRFLPGAPSNARPASRPGSWTDMTETQPLSLPIAVIGRGRLGTALAAALRDAGLHVDGPLGRTPRLDPRTGVVLLAVPDVRDRRRRGGPAPRPAGRPLLRRHHARAARRPRGVQPAPADDRHRRRCRLPGASAAVAGSTPRALQAAAALAAAVGLRAIEVDDEDRAAYHAAASIAANFLVTLEAAAERLAAGAGVDRAALRPLVQAALDNWARVGGERALTGPIARGDEATVARQRAAVAERTPELARAVRRAGRRHPRARPWPEPHDEDGPDRRRAARRAGRPSGGPGAASASSRRWARCTTATCR